MFLNICHNADLQLWENYVIRAIQILPSPVGRLALSSRVSVLRRKFKTEPKPINQLDLRRLPRDTFLVFYGCCILAQLSGSRD